MKKFILCANIAGMLFLFALVNWNSLNMPFERDEGEYAYSAWLMRQGDVPYKDSFLHKPPMIIYTYFAGQTISQTALWPIRLIASLFLLFTTLLIGLTAKKEYGGSAGWHAVWIFIPMTALPALSPFAANTEKFMLLPMTASIALYTFRSTTRVWPWFVSGMTSAIAVLYKPICLPVLLFVHLAWLYDAWSKPRDIKPVLKNILYAFSGGITAFAAVLGYFIYKQAWPYFWECNITFNRRLAEILGQTDLHAFAGFMKTFVLHWYIPAALFLWFLAVRPKKWLFYLSLLILCLLSAYRSPNGHYYILMLPILALICAGALSSIKTPYAHFIAAIAVISMCWNIKDQFFMTPVELSRAFYGGNPFAESQETAKHVAEITKPEDRVLVAGSEPQILYYAKRKSSTKFVIMYPLTLPTRLARAYQEEAVAEITRNPPSAIVLSKVYESWLPHPQSPEIFLPHVFRLLRSGQYTLIGGYVRESDAGRWISTSDKKRMEEASLLVFKKTFAPAI